MFALRQRFGKGVQFAAGQRGHFRVAALGHFHEVGAFGAGFGERLHRLGDRLQLGVFLAEAHDLSPVTGRGHAGFHLVEAVQHLVEFRLGKLHGGAS